MTGLNLNTFAKEITLKEGKAQSLSIAQVKEVIRLTLIAMAALPDKTVTQMLKRYKTD